MSSRSFILFSGFTLTFGILSAVTLLNMKPELAIWLPGCPFHKLTGLFCAGCGITRAIQSVIRGNLSMALAMNPLAVAAAPVALTLWIHEILGRQGRAEAVLVRLRDARLWCGIVLAFTVARNIPWQPFSWLAPGYLSGA